MTEHSLNVVQTIALRVVQQLLEGVSQTTCVRLAHDTVRRSICTIVGVGNTSRTSLCEVSSVGRSELQATCQSYLEVTCSISCITLVRRGVEESIRECVSRGVNRTLKTSVLLITIVVTEVTIIVNEDVTILIADIQRIDGSYLSSSSKDVTR